MSSPDETYLTAEARARRRIDRQLNAAGWIVQSMKELNLRAGRGVAVREVVLENGHGRADYLLVVDGQYVGVIEAKPEGVSLSGVETQSAKYVDGLPVSLPAPVRPLPFAYETTGVETRFTNGLDPDPRSRQVFSFHRPQTLATWIQEAKRRIDGPTFRARLLQMPPVPPTGLWDVQRRALEGLERSLAEQRLRALIQMATGAGKTLTAANASYRLKKFAAARRILFLVDRANLGRQAVKEFQQFTTPDDGRKFTELYNVQHLQSNVLDPAADVVITTIQRLYSILRGDARFDPILEESGPDETMPSQVNITYNDNIPIETFDLIIVDECHRSIYGTWRQVLEYFDAFIVGLTATPSRQTFGFFRRNCVTEYSHERAVADGVNVDFAVYRIRTEITQAGSTVDAGLVSGFRDRRTRRIRWEELDDDFTYQASDLDRTAVSVDQIRTIIRCFRDRLFTEIFPGRREVPKTLIFAKDDTHADDIVHVVREEFGRGNDFAVKITYRTTGRKPDDLLAEFRNSYNPRIVVSVDMMATGVDVKPLECVFFMRPVRSRTYFEQMKGRGVRVINDADFRAVTPDAEAKTHFVIVDAVDVTTTAINETVPLDREPTTPLDKLLQQLSMGHREPALLSSVATRLARLNRALTAPQRRQLEAAGLNLPQITRDIFAAIDADVCRELLQDEGIEEPDEEQVAEYQQGLLEEAIEPIVTSPTVRALLMEVRARYEQLIDETSEDKVLEAGFSTAAHDTARDTIKSFREFIEEHRVEIAALEILYSQPSTQRLTYRDIKELTQTLEAPPHRWTTEKLWKAFRTAEGGSDKSCSQRVLTDIIPLVRYAIGQQSSLRPYPELVNERFTLWLTNQEMVGRHFTSEQLRWLHRIRDHLATALVVSADDFSFTPFVEHGGLLKAYSLFGDTVEPIMNELNEALAA